ncbi:MAG: glycosyltransferase family 4 protein, partial [Solobacterium sp.]|nr:glycosyltransferase family 4 protein [Solobacterium sp.]
DDYKQVLNQYAQSHDILIDSIYSTKEGVYATWAFHKNHKKTVLIADGGLAKKRNPIMNQIISFFMKRHDYFFSSSNVTDRYFKHYGVDPNKILHYELSSFTKEDIENNRKLSERKVELRKELGLDDSFMWISVGRPIPRKGFDILVKAFHKSTHENEMCCYIVGGEAEENVNALINQYQIPNIHFIETLSKDDLAKYYAASDAFILPTRYDIWGLVINEAMSFGLPVITSDQCVAGMHFHEKNQSVFIVENENVDAYAEAMKRIYEDAEYRDRLSQLSLDIIQDNTIQNGAKDIVCDIKDICNHV